MWIKCKNSLLFQRRWMREWKTVLCHKVMDWDYPYNYAQQIKLFFLSSFSILGERNLLTHTQSSLGISTATIAALIQAFRSASWVELVLTTSKFAVGLFIQLHCQWNKAGRRRKDIPVKKESHNLFRKQKKSQRKLQCFLHWVVPYFERCNCNLEARQVLFCQWH